MHSKDRFLKDRSLFGLALASALMFSAVVAMAGQLQQGQKLANLHAPETVIRASQSVMPLSCLGQKA